MDIIFTVNCRNEHLVRKIASTAGYASSIDYLNEITVQIKLAKNASRNEFLEMANKFSQHGFNVKLTD